MSDTRKGSLRQVDRIDYSVYHSKGIKVPLKTPPVLTEVPIMEQEKDLEEKLRLKIKRFIDENDIDLLFDISDIEDAISGINALVSSFEDVHVVLKRQLEAQYAVTYPDFDDQISKVTTWIKKAKLAIKGKKQATFAAKKDPLEQAKARLTAEEKILHAKIDADITTFNDENSFFVTDIEENISSIKELSQSYSNLFIQISEVGEDFLTTFSDRFTKQSDKMNEFIRIMKKRIQKRKVEEQEAASKLKVQE